MSLLLIRHALTVQDRSAPAEEWRLDPNCLNEVAALGERLAGRAVHWYASDEPKALDTAAVLTSAPVTAVAGFREVQRGGWTDDYDQLVAKLFADPDQPAAPGWETARVATARFDTAIRGVLATHRPGTDVAVVTHGLVISLWRAHVAGRPVDLAAWRALRFPDLIEID